MATITPDELKQMTEQPTNGSAAIMRRSPVASTNGMPPDEVKSGGRGGGGRSVGAMAFTGGNDIHVGRDDEKGLAHEAWHTVQQGVGGFGRPDSPEADDGKDG